MKYTIDPIVLKKHNITLEEFLWLFLNRKNVNTKQLTDSLVNKKICDRNILDSTKPVLSDKSNELISSILINSDKSIDNKDAEFEELAKEMQELYPKGRKSGTTYYWRGSLIEITKKLKTLVVKYNIELNKEKILEATKSYIQSFNGDYTKMRLLKYFILKTDKDADGNIKVTSDLMALVENSDQESIDNDWTSRTI
jgi:hypothetical protein